MAEGSEEKKHAPTERRLLQAAERGDVLRPTDLPKAAAVALVILLALSAAGELAQHFAAYCAAWLSMAGTVQPAAAAGWAGTATVEILPLLALVCAVSVAATLVTGGFIFSPQLLKPDFSKMMPSHGLGQLVSKQGIADTAKALVKFVIIGGVGGFLIITRFASFLALAGLPHPSAGPVMALCMQLASAIAIVIGLAAGADMGLQYWLHRQKLRMSDNEIRDEMKDSAGNPHVRSRQRMIARKLARARQMHRVQEASVIVTNPTHYAVAIRYRRGADRAPLLLAKGVGMLAEEIISRGRGLGIPVVEAPPLARAVYRHVEPGEHMPVALYRACAEVLAYVWKMQRWRAQGGNRPTPPPVREGEIDVPRGMGL